MEAWKLLEFSFCIFNLFYLMLLYLKAPLSRPPQLSIMLLVIALRLFFSFLAHMYRCPIPKYACMFLVDPPSNFALFVLSFFLGFSYHTHGDYSLIEIIDLLSTYSILSIELDDSKVEGNNTALGPVKYLASISCLPAPYYLHLCWHLKPNSPASPNHFPTWFTILV